MLRRRGIETVILAGADPLRIMRAKRVPIADLLDGSALARDRLGDDVAAHCVAMRRDELAAQAAAVTDWETARYLEAL